MASHKCTTHLAVGSVEYQKRHQAISAEIATQLSVIVLGESNIGYLTFTPPEAQPLSDLWLVEGSLDMYSDVVQFCLVATMKSQGHLC